MISAASRELAGRWAEEVSAVEYPANPGWLQQLQRTAVESFSEHGLPHRKVEAWKYTPLKVLEAADPVLPAVSAERSGVKLGPALLPDAAMIVDVVDGALPETLPQAPRGVSLLPFGDALERFDDRLRALAERVDLAGPANAFVALNTAYLHRGLVVHVAAGVDAGTLLLRLVSRAGGRMQLHAFRLFLLLDPGARLELAEHHESCDGPAGALNLLVQGQLGDGAELGQVRVQNCGDEAVLLSTSCIEQGKESRFNFAGFDLGGGLVRHQLSTELAGEGATAALVGACVLDGSRHADTHVAVDHAAPGCRSEQFFRGVLGGRSRGVYNGRALIREGADGSSVKQSNANLLLSPLAEIDTKPELEIYADEVEASHGATVGQLDETAVFYLRSRGLSDAAARRLLTAAFCHTVTTRLENRELAEKIGEMLDAAMPEAV